MHIFSVLFYFLFFIVCFYNTVVVFCAFITLDTTTELMHLHFTYSLDLPTCYKFNFSQNVFGTIHWLLSENSQIGQHNLNEASIEIFRSFVSFKYM